MPVINIVGDHSPHIEATVNFNGKLDPARLVLIDHIMVMQLMLSCKSKRIFNDTILLSVYLILVFGVQYKHSFLADRKEYLFFYNFCTPRKITFFDVQKLVLLGVRG